MQAKLAKLTDLARRHKPATIVIGVLVALALIGSISDGDKPTTPAAAAPPAAVSATTDAAQPVAEPVETTPAAPALSAAQQQAIRKAEQYLEYTAFSRSGLIHQLEYEGFTNADATLAVDSLAVDWMEQAAKKAADYLEYSAFSRSGLIDQLEYEGFTHEQATHGADSVGL